MSAMCAPVPPEIAYTQMPGCFCFFAHAGGVSGRVRASAADTSSRSSRPSTRVTPNWRNTALVTASEPVRWPVCDAAIDWPAAVRPTFTITIGLRSDAAWSAASINVRPSLKPSM